MKNHNYWENPLFLWPFSIAMLYSLPEGKLAENNLVGKSLKKNCHFKMGFRGMTWFCLKRNF
jgi:hypothetical protein